MPRLSASSPEPSINITRLSTPVQAIEATAPVQNIQVPIAADAQPMVSEDPPSDAETLPFPIIWSYRD